MPDGQLKSHRLTVYVTGNILANQNPVLSLVRSHAVTTADESEGKSLMPSSVASGQQWTEMIDGREVMQSGTILMFDAGNMPLGWRAMVRVRPILTWTEGATQRSVIGPRDVNVGDIVMTTIWTLVVVGLALVVVIVLARRKGADPMLFLTGVDGHLSLAQTQVACWTIVVGSIVLGYGFVQLEIPQIPESLLVLMGASLVTGGVAYFQDAKRERAAERAGQATSRAWAWGDLVRIFPPGQPSEPSLAKAQMLFWTMLLLVLFVSKSMLEGQIWAVPWALVALMGFSQAGYLAPKLAPPEVTSAQPATPAPPPVVPPPAAPPTTP
jgi:hypothetical protein